MSDRPEHNDKDAQAPTALVEALRALAPQKPTVPPALDEDILQQARLHLQSLPSAERRLVPFPRWLAMAAALVLGVGVVFQLTREKHRETPLVREDIDGNGQVDILDAFALARKLQQGAVSAAVLDVNGDGVIDQRDIDWIAARAVKLHKG